MKCLDRDRLISYAYGLTDDPVARRVREHLDECSRCLEIVEQHERLHGLLNEWTVPEASPGFDFRVRQAIERRQKAPFDWRLWDWQWARGLAFAAMVVLMAAAAVWFGSRHFRPEPAPRAATRPAHDTLHSTPQTAALHSTQDLARAGGQAVHRVAASHLAGTGVNDDAQALEDYDLAANFDLLSELPKNQPRVAN